MRGLELGKHVLIEKATLRSFQGRVNRFREAQLRVLAPIKGAVRWYLQRTSNWIEFHTTSQIVYRQGLQSVVCCKEKLAVGTPKEFEYPSLQLCHSLTRQYRHPEAKYACIKVSEYRMS